MFARSSPSRVHYFIIVMKRYWSTHPDWAFAATMLGASMRGFETDYEIWRKADAKHLWRRFLEWNEELSTRGSAEAVTFMAVADEAISEDPSGATKSSLHATIVADPASLMDAEYVDAYAVNWGGDPASVRYASLEYVDAEAAFSLVARNSTFGTAFPAWQIKPANDDGAAADDAFDPHLAPVTYATVNKVIDNAGLFSTSHSRERWMWMNELLLITPLLVLYSTCCSF
jgi:hypothetical protein